MKKYNHKSILGLIALLFISFSSLSYAFFISSGDGKKGKDKVDLKLIETVIEHVKDDYVEEVDNTKILEGALNGILTALDSHSNYLNPKAYKELRQQTKGLFGGLGIEVTMEYGVIKVISAIDDTPAHKQGLKPGDYIVWIDDQPVIGLTLSEAVDKMRGDAGTTVKLKIIRANEDPFDVTFKRDIIKVRSVKHKIFGTIGYLRIALFNEQTTDLLKESLKDIRTQLKDNLQGIILDLRYNPGGLFSEAIEVAGSFIKEGEIVSVRGRNGKNIMRYKASGNVLIENVPMVVLINSGTASSSEIVAGALKDHNLAVIMGTRSFGKGSVQMLVPLNNNGAIKMTTSRYYPPSGEAIQGNGIEPHITINQAKVELIEDKAQREENYPKALKDIKDLSEKKKEEKKKEEKKEKTDSKPDKVSEKKETEVPEELQKDYQLARAVDLLKAYGTFKGALGTQRSHTHK